MVRKKRSDEEFWKGRSRDYNNLEWVKEPSYLETIIKCANFNKEDFVLDVGTGTGIIAHEISPLVKEVIGLDKSQEMLEHINFEKNKYFIKRDIRDPIFCEQVFDKVIARMVFHHILENTQEAMDECYKVLKKHGKMVLAEAVPPTSNPEVMDYWGSVFALKEKRITFSEEGLVSLMQKSGFEEITVTPYVMKEFSVKNWLSNSGLPKKTQEKIYDMHANGPKLFKRAHNMECREGDCYIDSKCLVLVGKK